MTQVPPQSDAAAPAPEAPEPELVAIVMSPKAARQLAAACQWGMFRAEDALDSGGAATALARARAAEARDWFNWGSRWLLDGTRIEVPDA